jgi:hypothetical protein
MSFNQKTVDRAGSIDAHRLFPQVLPPVVFLLEGDQGGLLLTVEEGTTSRFDGISAILQGLRTRALFHWLADISLGNLLGTGRFLALIGRNAIAKPRSWNSGIANHGLLVCQFQSLWLRTADKDTTYVDRAIDLDLDLRCWKICWQRGISRRDVSPDSLGALFWAAKSRTGQPS